ncbi:MAG: hypothetical protein R3C39_07590 [Dehalococcoidia bacterium]
MAQRRGRTRARRRVDGPRAIAAVARDAATAERWQAVLAAHDIEAHVTVEDAAAFGDRSSVYVVANRVPDTLFAYAVTVPAAAIEDARQHLRAAGWDGHLGETPRTSWSPRQIALTTVAVFAAAAAMIALAALRAS